MAPLQSEDLPRSELVSMIADLRGICYSVLFLLKYPDDYELPREQEELIQEIEFALRRTAADASERDLVEGAFDKTHRERFAADEYANRGKT